MLIQKNINSVLFVNRFTHYKSETRLFLKVSIKIYIIKSTTHHVTFKTLELCNTLTATTVITAI